MTATAIGTIAAKNYLSFARVLASSVKERHPEVPVYLLLTDRVEGAFDPAAEPFQLLELGSLGVPRLDQFAFRYLRQELAAAVKPYLLGYLLDAGFDNVLFLDPDVWVLGDLTPLLAPSGAIQITPHLLTPPKGPDRFSRELTILRAGTYNGGCVAVSNTPAARRFLGWWQDRLALHCRQISAAGMNFDQRWIDLAPGLFEGLEIVRDPACNVAYWNLRERGVGLRGEILLARGSPCRFFHFSGFNPDAPQMVTRHVPGLRTADLGEVGSLFERYARRLLGAGHDDTKRLPYAYSDFSNGVPIPEVARQEYLEMGPAASSFGDPFDAASPSSYFQWLMGSDDERFDPTRRIRRIWDTIHRRRPDLQQAFPDPRGADREAFLEWTIRFGAAEHGIAEPFLGRFTEPSPAGGSAAAQV